ncbi:MAG TPA: hypothetical protein DG753_05780 [Clostridium sp.]|nr:hypothetical protein [Clostridium sp.]
MKIKNIYNENKLYNKNEFAIIVENRERDYKIHAKKKDINYNLDQEFIGEEIKKPCTYCGGYFGVTIDGQNYNGLDRRNNGDYSKEECVSCCKTCNLSKGKMTQKEFIEHIEKIYNNVKNN